jgi:hypothetical protein
LPHFCALTMRGFEAPENDSRPVSELEASEESEDEEEFVLVDLPSTVSMLPGEHYRIDGLDTDEPTLRTTNGKTYKGYYELTVGEALIVQRPFLGQANSKKKKGIGLAGEARKRAKADSKEDEEEKKGGKMMKMRMDKTGREIAENYGAKEATIRGKSEIRLKFRK